MNKDPIAVHFSRKGGVCKHGQFDGGGKDGD